MHYTMIVPILYLNTVKQCAESANIISIFFSIATMNMSSKDKTRDDNKNFGLNRQKHI